jgi:hypothetical protein
VKLDHHFHYDLMSKGFENVLHFSTLELKSGEDKSQTFYTIIKREKTHDECERNKTERERKNIEILALRIF